MVSYKELQVYFLGSGEVAVFQQEQRVMSPEERFLPAVRAGGFEIPNRSRGVHLSDSSLYFLGARGSVCKFDMKLVARAAEQKKTYRAESLPTGTAVDFVPWGRNRLLALSERGVITLVESYRSVRQTPQVAQEETHTAIGSFGEADSKVLVASFCAAARRSTFRLLSEDLKELYVHPLDQEGSLRSRRHPRRAPAALPAQRAPPRPRRKRPRLAAPAHRARLQGRLRSRAPHHPGQYAPLTRRPAPLRLRHQRPPRPRRLASRQ